MSACEVKKNDGLGNVWVLCKRSLRDYESMKGYCAFMYGRWVKLRMEKGTLMYGKGCCYFGKGCTYVWERVKLCMGKSVILYGKGAFMYGKGAFTYGKGAFMYGKGVFMYGKRYNYARKRGQTCMYEKGCNCARKRVQWVMYKKDPIMQEKGCSESELYIKKDEIIGEKECSYVCKKKGAERERHQMSRKGGS